MVVLESMEQNMARIKKAETGGQAEVPHWTDAVILLSDVVQAGGQWG
jgi:hypothetical protein